MRIQFAVLPLVLAAAFVTPASANYFSDAMSGMNRNVASAPTPTPDDLRAVGDSDLGAGKSYYYNKADGHWHEVRPGQQPPAPARQIPQNRQ